ncbi:HAD-IA family hydrolase [Thioalkalicoccus limnaeus]|uniref:HAD-IA family hydrolase n=1 Tax=Thioalkalicoccus limnaeus TaxID=120681 RepID=A0ABV4BEM3_9GAMM
MSLRLIVFDWDGTLMDSEARIVACIQAAFVDIGEPPPPVEAARNVIGLGLEEAMAMLWPDADIEARRAVEDRYRTHFLGGNETPSELFPDARAILSWLDRRGYRLGVATGKSRRGLDEALATTSLDGFFQATRCADETRSKPHPEMLLQLMDELRIAPSETLMVGDTEYDMEMARNAGVGALAVAYGVHARERLLAHRPLGCLEVLGELPAWLECHDPIPDGQSGPGSGNERDRREGTT